MKKIFLLIIIFLGSCTTPIGGAKKIEDIKPQETPSIETIEAGLWMQMNNFEEILNKRNAILKKYNMNEQQNDEIIQVIKLHTQIGQEIINN